MTPEDIKDLKTLFVLGRQNWAEDRNTIIRILKLEEKVMNILDKKEKKKKRK